MKNILRAIGAGLLLGVALFLFPFLGRILLFVLLLRGIFRLLRGGRRGVGRRGLWAGRAMGGPAYFGGALPIDNQWYRPGIAPSGAAHSVTVG